MFCRKKLLHLRIIQLAIGGRKNLFYRRIIQLAIGGCKKLLYRRIIQLAIGGRKKLLYLRIIQLAIGGLKKLPNLLGIVKAAGNRLGSPEGWGHGAWLALADNHIIVGDGLDLPGLCAQGELLPDPGLPDKFLVKLANAGHVILVAKLKVAAIRDDATAKIKGQQGAFICLHLAGLMVNADARLEFTDPAVSIAASQHIDHQVKLQPGELLKGCGPPHFHEEIIQLPGIIASSRASHGD